MANQAPSLERKIRKFIDEQFASVDESQQLLDLKEELVTNLREKIEDYRLKGLDDKQAFQEAVISLGDLSGLVEDMRKFAQTPHTPSAINNYLSTAGIVVGVLLILSGLFIGAMVYFTNDPLESSFGQGIFIVIGGVLLTYSILTRETDKRFAMNKLRAGLYALAIGLILFSIFSGILAGISTGQIHSGIAATFVFFVSGVGVLLACILTEKDRTKGKA